MYLRQDTKTQILGKVNTKLISSKVNIISNKIYLMLSKLFSEYYGTFPKQRIASK